MEIIFLGTGGGRKNLILQSRRTAGLRINGSMNVHIDPGPSTLSACREFGQDPQAVHALVVTHNHIDHANDAGVMAEAMSNEWGRKKGILIASKSVVSGDRNGDRGISNYHLSKLSRVIEAAPGQRIRFAAGGGEAAIFPKPVKHDDERGFGFVLEMDGRRIGCTSDTEYFDGIGAHYKGCDVLIAHNLKAKEDGIPGHMFTAQTAELVSEAKPKLAVITHLGMGLIKSGPEKEAEKIRKLTGIRTVAATDGMRIILDGASPKVEPAK